MKSSARACALLAAALALTACGGSEAPNPAPNTVAGCKEATVQNIVSGAQNTDGPNDPACQGLSDADVMKAGADAFADPKVKAYMATMIREAGNPSPSP